MKPKHFYNNGTVCIKIEEGSPIPEGFIKGFLKKNKTPWNKGLTKETDARVAAYGEKVSNTLRGSVPWNKGLTKISDDRLLLIGEKISKTKINNPRPSWNKGIPMRDESKQKLSESLKGQTSWNKGLTKYTDERVARTSQKLMGHKDFCTDWVSAKAKEYETKKRNGSFNSSKPENGYYEYLVKTYGSDDVVRQYFDKDRYPFNCDFYIKSLDLFIEFQYSWLHGEHPFDSDSEEDRKRLQDIIDLANSTNSRFYQSFVYVWSDLDVRKLNTARNNGLKFRFIYPNMVIDS